MKLTMPKIALLVASPISAGLITTLATSCNYLQVYKPVTPATTELKANKNNLAWVEVNFAQQPKGNEAMVSVVSNSDVELEIIDGQNSYETVDTIRVDDKKGLVIIGVVEKPKQSQTVDFDLHFSYIDENNKAVSYVVEHMKMKIEVDPEQLTDEVHILDINDLHGTIPGYGSLNFKPAYNEPGALRLARDTHRIIKQYPGSIFLSAGDNNSGNVFSVATHGETLYPMLKAMDVQYSAVGNHAFEWGLDNMSAERFDRWARTDTTTGKYFIASNILTTPNYKDKQWITDPTMEGYYDDYHIWQNQLVSWADPYKILNLKGHRVCVIGLTTQKTEEDGNTEVTKHLSFIDYVAAVKYAKQYCLDNIGQADYNRIESFILLTHVESDYTDPNNPTGAAIELAKSIDTRVDAIISAHSHKVGVAKVHNVVEGNDIFVGQAGKHGMKFLDTKLVFDNTKPTGSKLSNLEMKLQTPTIDYGGFDPESSQGKTAADKEYLQLLSNPEDEFNKNVVDELKKQALILNEALSEEYATSEFGQRYDIKGKNLGHDYIMFDNVLEPMGAWVERARLYSLNKLVDPSIAQPWVSFMSQDSITHNWNKGEVITKKDMFAVQTYENHEVLGYLTIGQIANIINYILCGKTQFNYDTNKVYNGRLNWDMVQEIYCTGVDLEETGKSENTSCYLCGPLQFYGISIELRPNSKPSVIDSDYELYVKNETYTDKQEVAHAYACPQFKLYDPTKVDEHGHKICNLDNPDTWIPAQKYIEQEFDTKNRILIPVLINDFVYNGKLASNRMFKQYFLFNATNDPTKSPQIFSQISRDLLIDFSEHWATYVPTGAGTYDINPAIVQKMVTIHQE